MTSSVDPTAAMAAIVARLGLLGETLYEGIPQGTVLPLDGFGNKVPYRDFEPGSVIPSANGRLMAGNEQDQPHIWAFQIHHYASSRAAAVALAIASDLSLIGWEPTSDSSAVKPFFFTVYDETAKNGERLGWVATRFYETTLGENVQIDGPIL